MKCGRVEFIKHYVRDCGDAEVGQMNPAQATEFDFPLRA